MAYLLSTDDNIRCYLRAHHVFGRLAESVNTLMVSPEVSKIHLLIEWRGSGWYLTDNSSNGTWLNKIKLKKHHATKISVGDIINCASKKSNEYIVKDISSPCDMLVSYEYEKDIRLNIYNLLPNDKNPEISIFYDDATSQWFSEYLDVNSSKEHIRHGDVFEFGGGRWLMMLNSMLCHTVELRPSVSSIADLVFDFQVSADEESVQLTLHTPDQVVDLKAHSHHYLALTLARKRIEDNRRGINMSEQGWMYTDELSRCLGLEETHVNIQVHRARKQFSEYINSNLDQLFERKSGKIRFGSSCVKIVKGGSEEYVHKRDLIDELG